MTIDYRDIISPYVYMNTIRSIFAIHYFRKVIAEVLSIRNFHRATPLYSAVLVVRASQ